MIAVVPAIMEIVTLRPTAIVTRTRRNIRMYVGLARVPCTDPGSVVDQDVMFMPAKARTAPSPGCERCADCDARTKPYCASDENTWTRTHIH